MKRWLVILVTGEQISVEADIYTRSQTHYDFFTQSNGENHFVTSFTALLVGMVVPVEEAHIIPDDQPTVQ